MCGIAGAYCSAWNVHEALERIAHRGPDGSGVLSHGDMVHGHARLAVLDLSSASNQPFRYRDAVLSFNGEIWNFRELRCELERIGHTFITTGDTEVLAAALWQWGTDALKRLEGMFAFAWSRGSVYILARDRYGKVPLYVQRKDNAFTWSSERKAWGARRGAAAAPLPPGTWLDLPTGKVHSYYSLPEHVACGDVLSLLREGVRRRMVADAPLCVLISGGLDSAAILTLASQINRGVVAYTAKLRSDAPDLIAARRLCAELGVRLHEVQVPEPTTRSMEEASRVIEIPSKAQTEIAMLCLPLARRISADGFKVCLSGEASDELFGAYGNMKIKAWGKEHEWRPIRVAQLGKMARGNFVRCNKAFMAAGVECRLPFMERALVERVLSMSMAECPPNKVALKRALNGVVPAWVIKRQKETFQGSSGMSDACARVVANPTRFYNATIRRLFGGMVDA